MEMLLMILCMSLFGLGVMCAAFRAAAPPQQPLPPAPPEVKPTAQVQPSRFFAEGVGAPRTRPPQVPIEVLLLQIENHVRLEQAAAESFLEAPAADLLHSRTMSALVN